MKKALVLQARPEKEASDAEFSAILARSGLDSSKVHRVNLGQGDCPSPDQLDRYCAVILGGGPGCVSDAPETKNEAEAKIEAEILTLMPRIAEDDFPFMGCCLGIGILGHHLGRHVSKENFAEPVGVAHCAVTTDGATDAIMAGVNPEFDAFVGHKEALQVLPEDCVHLASSSTCKFQMIRYKRNVYATQFHPEADGEEFELRINMYRHRGYFAPEDADRLIALCKSADVTEPEKILRNFVRKYVR